MCETSEPTYISVKEIIMETISNSSTVVTTIGGVGQRIQIDETAICNGIIVSNPYSRLDSEPGIRWIIGGVLEGNCREFFVELIPNRKWETILLVLKKYVKVGTDIVTDGYPSYPRAISEFGSHHSVVNHSMGFCNEEGQNTNYVENMWSHLKHDYRKRGGMNKIRIKCWLDEF
ncbi:DDE-TNP-IS1595 domain-containing protein [Vairimorpha necatrix]